MDLEQVISSNLRRIRYEKGMSQRLLAEKTGLDEKFISQLENKPRHVSTRTIGRLAEGLGVDEGNLLLREREPQEDSICEEWLAGVEESIRILRVFRERLIK